MRSAPERRRDGGVSLRQPHRSSGISATRSSPGARPVAKRTVAIVRRPGQSRLIIACWASAHESIHRTWGRWCRRRTFSTSSRKPGEKARYTSSGRSPRGSRIRPVDEDELELPAGAEASGRGLGQDGLVEDVALKRVGGEIVEREPMPGQLLETARDDDLRRRVGRRRWWSGRSRKDLRHFRLGGRERRAGTRLPRAPRFRQLASAIALTSCHPPSFDSSLTC